jgi:two-component system, NtrC family, sensor kinase
VKAAPPREVNGKVMFVRSADSALVTARPPRSADAVARLAAGTAHELNNPLSVIVGYLSLILNGQTSPTQLQDQLQRVAAEAQHCRLVLRSLTELADAALGEPERLDLRALVVEVVAALPRPPLQVSISGDMNAHLWGQPRGLSALISHGIQNAIEASARSLLVKLTQAEGSTRLELSDDGKGMSEQVLARAREPFFSTKKAHLGLGLALCDAVAWSHDGAVSLASAEGRGATLVLTLPAGLPRR